MTLAVAVTQDIETCLSLRRVVFMDEQGVSLADEVDGLDPECLHLLALVGTQPVGTARVYFDADTAKIGRVCVLKPHRGSGLGAMLIMAALTHARGKARQAVLGAQIDALGFYEKLGFTAFGPVYDDAGIAHRDMRRAL